MHVVNCRNVNDGLPAALDLLRVHGVREESRNGPVLRMPCPVSTVFARPMERVLFAPWRDANPFFHCCEAIWMLAGRDDLKQLTPYVKRMAEYSDDGGVTQPAAYGKRWRNWEVREGGTAYNWGDQLDWAVERLRKDTGDRRVVIQMWDPPTDKWAAQSGGKDVPCNLTMLPWISGGALRLTVFNRSHDIIWGLFGANVVHFSVAQEYLAGRLGLGVGTLTFISNNFHAYEATMPDIAADYNATRNPYSGLAFPFSDQPAIKPDVQPYSMWTDWAQLKTTDTDRERILQEDLRVFFEHGAVEAATKARWPWLRRVAVPLALAHQHWKGGRGEARYTGALEILERCAAPDWRLAAEQWVRRRYDRWKVKADDGMIHDQG